MWKLKQSCSSTKSIWMTPTLLKSPKKYAKSWKTWKKTKCAVWSQSTKSVQMAEKSMKSVHWLPKSAYYRAYTVPACSRVDRRKRCLLVHWLHWANIRSSTALAWSTASDSSTITISLNSRSAALVEQEVLDAAKSAMVLWVNVRWNKLSRQKLSSLTQSVWFRKYWNPTGPLHKQASVPARWQWWMRVCRSKHR